MDKRNILADFDRFLQEHGDEAYARLDDFLSQESSRFYDEHGYENDRIARQAWVVIAGDVLEEIIRKLVKHFCAKHNLGITSDRELANPATLELERVRGNIEVFFNDYSLLPDADVVIFLPSTCEVLAILSVKGSFRERYTETPYWTLNLKQRQATRNVRVFMITPDRDGEISRLGKHLRKARIVMEYELDGIYLAKKEFDRSDKVRSISELIGDLERLLLKVDYGNRKQG
ncbi:MAG: BsaWI family type II restriction enzyme [Anaerolineae bacterium]|nr:BsaWI family type II restriction enzyme [Anaerolineae bacterium]